MDMRSLRSEPDRQLTSGFLIIGDTTTGVNGSRMDARDIHILLDYHAAGSGFGKGGIRASTITRLPVIDLIGGLPILFIGTQQRRISIKSLLGIDDNGQRLIIDIDSLHTIGGGIAAGGDNKGYFLHLIM